MKPHTLLSLGVTMGLFAVAGCPQSKEAITDGGAADSAPNGGADSGSSTADLLGHDVGADDLGALSAVDLASPFFPGTLSVALTVKDTAGVGATNYPVSAVVPLAAGSHQSTTGMRVVRDDGTPVPSQIEILARRSATDDSLRHVLVHFLADVDPHTTVGTGQASYRLQDDGIPPAPAQPTSITETSTNLTIAAGNESIVITRAPFAITTSKGTLSAEMLVNRANGSTELQSSFARTDITIEVEERGPIRSVIRCSAPTRYTNGVEHVHGWALRLYAYADQPFVKLDFQIQNSARTAKYAPPLYYDYVDLVWAGGSAGTPSSLSAEKVTVDPRTLPLGWLATSERAVHLRQFQARWPSGLVADAGGTIRVELWPRWSAQPEDGDTNATNQYWLDDMRHVVKEVTLHLGPVAPSDADAVARRLEYRPVVTVPYAWWQSTRASLDLGGRLPPLVDDLTSDERMPPYERYSDAFATWAQKLSTDRFALDLDRRLAPSQAGGWPYSRARFLASEAPADYFAAEDFALAEVNIRPEWLAGYRHATDQATLQLTENPYGSFSWRAFDGTYGYDAANLEHRPSTGPIAKPRDDEHGWFYHVEEGWLASGNPWLGDWYRFVAEFRKTRLEQRDPWPDMTGRAVGHALGHALAAYRVTSDATLIAGAQRFVEDYLVSQVDTTTHGIHFHDDFRPDDPRNMSGKRLASEVVEVEEAVFQLGYLSRALVTLVEESAGGHLPSQQLVAGFVEWNRAYANFSYYIAYDEHNAASDGTAMTFCDAIAWSIEKGLGDPLAARAHLVDFVDGGIGGGMAPYGDCSTWSGDFVGRVSSALFQGPP